MIKINKNLALFSGLFILLGSILLVIVNKFSPLLGHAVYYCQSFFNAYMIPIPHYLSLVPLGLLFLILTIATSKFLLVYMKIKLLQYKLKKEITVKNNTRKLIENLGLEKKTIIVQSEKRFAFCLGIRKPKIYFSTGLVSQLSLKEMEAVLRHEQYHLENHDTFTMTIGSVSHSLFPFFPLLGDLIKKYRIEREIQADTFAVKKLGDAYPLISALKKLLSYPTVTTVALAAIADEDTLEPRIYALLKKRYNRRQFRIKHLLMTLFSLFVLGVTLLTPVHAEEIHYEKRDFMMFCSADEECMRSCTNEANMRRLYSEMPKSSHSYTPTKK